MVRFSASEHAEREAVVDSTARLSFTQVAAEVDRASRAFMAYGVAHGDRVGIWAPNIRQWIIAALAVIGVGGAVVPLNTRYKGHEAGYILEKSGASTLFTVTDFLGTDYVAELRGALGGPSSGSPIRGLAELRRIAVLSGEAPPGTDGWLDVLDGHEAVDGAALEQRQRQIGPDSLSDILFTSGTTGKPKGVMVTHAMTLRQYADWTEIIGLRAGDRYLIVNPFFHVFGFKAGFLSAIMRGATTIPMTQFDADEVLSVIEREQVSMLPGPPTIHQTILNHPRRDDYDLSSLRLCATGSADVPVEMIRRMRDELSYETIVTGYGLTECTGTATMCRHDDPPERIATTSGRAIPDVEVKIVDDDMNELERGAQGEIVIRGYNVMVGYYDEPAQTAEAIDADGWLHSGDLGVMDEDGYVAITGRKKDMFIVGGFNAYPAEIEDTLLQYPGVGQVAVAGVPDERLGEVGMAWIVPRPGELIDTQELLDWARRRLANYKLPRYVEIVDSLPTNAAGKVLKYELAQRGADLVRARRSG